MHHALNTIEGKKKRASRGEVGELNAKRGAGHADLERKKKLAISYYQKGGAAILSAEGVRAVRWEGTKAQAQ